MRLKIIRITVIILFLCIVTALIYMQGIRGLFYYKLSKNNSIRIVHMEGWRGRIIDRNGKILADNKIAFNVMLTPQDIQRKDKLFSFLSDALGIKKDVLIDYYNKKFTAPFIPIVIADNIKKDTAIIIEENKYLYPSLYVQESFKRFYPTGKDSAHVIGYVGKINRLRADKYKEYGYSPQSLIGYSGIEEYYDFYLKGEEGGSQIEINSRGEQVRLLSVKNPSKGQDIVVTIDSKLQRNITQLLDGYEGSIVVMDMDNGEILGLASSPAFDPNIFIEGNNSAKMSKLFSNTKSPLIDRAITGLFPPGSVFKVPVAVCALENNKITPQTTFTCNGFLDLGGTRFRCTHVHGSQNLVQALAHSCNVYFYHVGLNLGADLISKCAHTFGLGRLTHIDLPYEEEGYIPNRRQGVKIGRKHWFTGDTLNLSIGQGYTLVTPIQMVKMISTVYNDGVEVQPHVISSIGKKKVNKYSVKKKVNIPDDIFENVKKGLRAAVEDFSGTAHVLDLDGLYIAGKTGTAQSSGNKENHAWFVGYVLGKKKLAFCVLIEHGGSSHNACILARQMVLQMQKDGIL